MCQDSRCLCLMFIFYNVCDARTITIISVAVIGSVFWKGCTGYFKVNRKLMCQLKSSASLFGVRTKYSAVKAKSSVHKHT
jgi:hypothetical protein